MAANLSYSQIFLKHYRKRVVPHPKLDQKFKQRLKLLLSNTHHPLLKDHALSGTKLGFRAFSITGDIRVIYKKLKTDAYYLYDIGTHNQVYK